MKDISKGIRLKTVFCGILVMLLAVSAFGCGKTAEPLDTGSLPEMPPAFTGNESDIPGKLTGVRYEYSAGSMNYHSEFAIDLTRDEIKHCEYWGTSSNDMVQKDNVPVTEEQWADVEKAVLGLMGVWREIPEEVLNQEPDPEYEIEVLDGGDYSRWYLTWETDEGTETLQYYDTSDRRILTLTDLLYNLADGKNRKITWYEPPELASATYINDNTNCSFQCTWWEGENSGYRFIVRFDEGGRKVDIYDHTDDRIWEAARPAFEWLDFDSFPDGSYSDPVVLNVTYTDQSYKTVDLDDETAAIIEPYLRELTLLYLDQKSDE